MVFFDMLVRMSPGPVGGPAGEVLGGADHAHHVEGQIRAGRRPASAPTTAAAPDMSCFISSMAAEGLIEMPPESKVTPLPTRQIGRAAFFGGLARRLGGALCSSTISRGGLARCRRRRRGSRPSSASSARARAEHRHLEARPPSRPSRASRASAAGGRALPGSFERSRATFWDSAIATPRLRGRPRARRLSSDLPRLEARATGSGGDPRLRASSPGSCSASKR